MSDFAGAFPKNCDESCSILGGVFVATLSEKVELFICVCEIKSHLNIMLIVKKKIMKRTKHQICMTLPT